MDEEYYCNHCYEIRDLLKSWGLPLAFFCSTVGSVPSYYEDRILIPQPDSPYPECRYDPTHHERHFELTISGVAMLGRKVNFVGRFSESKGTIKILPLVGFDSES